MSVKKIETFNMMNKRNNLSSTWTNDIRQKAITIYKKMQKDQSLIDSIFNDDNLNLKEIVDSLIEKELTKELKDLDGEKLVQLYNDISSSKYMGTVSSYQEKFFYSVQKDLLSLFVPASLKKLVKSIKDCESQFENLKPETLKLKLEELNKFSENIKQLPGFSAQKHLNQIQTEIENLDKKIKIKESIEAIVSKKEEIKTELKDTYTLTQDETMDFLKTTIDLQQQINFLKSEHPKYHVSSNDETDVKKLINFLTIKKTVLEAIEEINTATDLKTLNAYKDLIKDYSDLSFPEINKEIIEEIKNDITSGLDKISKKEEEIKKNIDKANQEIQELKDDIWTYTFDEIKPSSMSWDEAYRFLAGGQNLRKEHEEAIKIIKASIAEESVKSEAIEKISAIINKLDSFESKISNRVVEKIDELRKGLLADTHLLNDMEESKKIHIKKINLNSNLSLESPKFFVK